MPLDELGILQEPVVAGRVDRFAVAGEEDVLHRIMPVGVGGDDAPRDGVDGQGEDAVIEELVM